jgi:hypothetical protein
VPRSKSKSTQSASQSAVGAACDCHRFNICSTRRVFQRTDAPRRSSSKYIIPTNECCSDQRPSSGCLPRMIEKMQTLRNLVTVDDRFVLFLCGYGVTVEQLGDLARVKKITTQETILVWNCWHSFRNLGRRLSPGCHFQAVHT